MAGRGSGGASGSAPKKKSIFRGIEPFKHKVEIDPDYAAKTWKKLEDAIHEIHNLNNAYGLSFEELYRCVRSIKPCSFAARRVGLASFSLSRASHRSTEGGVPVEEREARSTRRVSPAECPRPPATVVSRPPPPGAHKTKVQTLEGHASCLRSTTTPSARHDLEYTD